MRDPTSPAAIALLHILPQDGWHDPAAIVGNREGLTRLRDAINDALQNGTALMRAMPNDGEGYSIAVACRESMGGIPYGYTDEVAAHHSEGWPAWLQALAYQKPRP